MSAPYWASARAAIDGCDVSRVAAPSTARRVSDGGATAPRSGALGNSAKSQAASGEYGEYRVLRASPGQFEGVDSATGELATFATGRKLRRIDGADSAKAARFRLQDGAARLLGRHHRVSSCLKKIRPGGTDVPVYRTIDGSTHYGGLHVCGSVWACPVCAAKVSERRRAELASAIELHRANGGQVLLATFTFPHSRGDDLADLLRRLKVARAKLRGHRQYKTWAKAAGLIGTVRALEITHGVNGWHPHIHELLFLPSGVDPDGVQRALFALWSNAAVAAGFAAPNERFGLDVRGGDFAASYAAKWGLEHELAKQVSKSGRGGRSAFDLLRDYLEGDAQAGALFVEYATAFKGQRQLVWSRGLKSLFSIEETSDEDVAAAIEETAQEVGRLTWEDWRRVLRFRERFTVLALAAVSWPVALEFVRSLPPSPSGRRKPPH